mgnify:CR=1 FL=1
MNKSSHEQIVHRKSPQMIALFKMCSLNARLCFLAQQLDRDVYWYLGVRVAGGRILLLKTSIICFEV